MKRNHARLLFPIAVAVVATAVALTGCDKLAGDHYSPYRVQGPDRQASELAPGLWRTVPPTSVGGCTYALHRNGIPVFWAEAHDSVPVYVWLPETTADTDWGLTTVGCGTWKRVTQ